MAKNFNKTKNKSRSTLLRDRSKSLERSNTGIDIVSQLTRPFSGKTEDANKLKLIFVGPMGYGKSSTANKILAKNCFTSANAAGRVTNIVQIAENKNTVIADCPGFGDNVSDKTFHGAYLDAASTLYCMCPIDAIVLVIKFNDAESMAFLNAAKDVHKFFGTPAFRSLIILCIQAGSYRYSDNDFHRVLIKTAGYKYLKAYNYDDDIPYVLWDNFDPYEDQLENLYAKIKSVQYYNTEKLEFLLPNYYLINKN